MDSMPWATAEHDSLAVSPRSKDCGGPRVSETGRGTRRIVRLSYALAVLLLILSAPGKAGADVGRGVGVQVIRDEQGKAIGLYQESHALLIGAGNYRAGWPKLPGVRNDLIEIKTALEKAAFQVTVVEDPDRRTLQEAIDRFINTYGLQLENRLLVYFAGHGFTIRHSYGDEMGYIVPVDTPNPNIDRNGFFAKAMDMQQMEVYARRIQAKHALFVFDSCFSGSIFALSRAVPGLITFKTNRPVRQFITSGGADEQVPDKSVFREQFVAGISGEADVNQDGYVTGTELSEFLQDKVVNYSKNAQHPQYGKIRNPALDKGDFVFILEGAARKGDDGSAAVAKAPVVTKVPLYGGVRVTSNIDGAAFSLLGSDFKTDAGAKLVIDEIPLGEYSILAQKEGYEDFRGQVAVRAGQASNLHIQMVKRQSPGQARGIREEIIFEEHFADNRHKWHVAGGNEVVNGHYLRESRNRIWQNVWKAVSINPKKDFSIEVTAQKISGSDEQSYGLTFGLKDGKNFFYFVVDGNGRVIHSDIRNGKENIRVNRYFSAVRKGAKNKLTVIKSQDRLHFYVNDQEVNEGVPFMEFYGDKIGFFVASGGEASERVQFDDLIVKHLEGLKP